MLETDTGGLGPPFRGLLGLWGGAFSGAPLRSGLESPFLKLFGPSPFRAFDSLRLDEGLGLSGGYLVSWAKALSRVAFSRKATGPVSLSHALG